MKLIVSIKIKGVLYPAGTEVPEKVFKLYPKLKKLKNDKSKGKKGTSGTTKGSSSDDPGNESSGDTEKG